MKRIGTLLIFSLFLSFGSFFVAPAHAQVLDIPKIPTLEENASFPVLKTEYTKLATLLPRLENTLTLLTKRGFDTTEALESFEETKVSFGETKELFEKKSIKRSVIEEKIKENRLLLTQTLKEIRISLTSKEN
jgi:hypothetical protein